MRFFFIFLVLYAFSAAAQDTRLSAVSNYALNRPASS